jgi:DNA (cytosine-5)-methyltransferase 1
LKSLELFTGAGGLALGTHLAGFEHVGLLEWNRDACNTLRLNAAANALPGISQWPVEEADIKTINFSRFRGVELVAGGVPCQPFSIGGKHQAMDDARDMFPDFVRAIRTLQPRAFIVENVKGLLRQSFRNYFSYITLQLTHPDIERSAKETWESHLKRLEDFHTRGRCAGLNYNVVFRLLNAADFGVPQTRERVFIVGFRSDVGVDWHFPEPTHSEAALLRTQFITAEYWMRHGIRKPPNLKMPTAGVLARAASEEMFPMSPWRTVRDAIADLPKATHSRDHSLISNHRINLGARSYVGHTGSFIEWPSKTLKAGVHGVPGGENMIAFSDGSVRYFTVREAARIQTFPDRWRFEGAWSEAMRQLGNAVPVELASVVAKSVAEKLLSSKGMVSTRRGTDRMSTVLHN